MPKKEFDPVIKDLQKKIDEYRLLIKELKKNIVQHKQGKKENDNKFLFDNQDLIIRFD